MIKFLMKKEGLIGSNLLTSFSLIVLVIFYLQQLKNPLIPSVSHLQSLSSSPEITAEWETSFTKDTKLLPPSNNEASIIELLKEFFEFYASFEFGLYVISTFTGKSYLKPIFAVADLLPDEYKCFKKNIEKGENYEFHLNKFMCVQGPFNHSRNVTWTVSPRILHQFQTFCSDCAKICQEVNDAEQNKPENLLKLFNKNDEDKSKKIKNNCICLYVGDSLPLTGYDLQSLTEDDLRREWAENVFKTVKDVLMKIMKCQVDVVSEQGKGESFANGDRTKVLKCQFHYFELMSKRKEVRSEFQFSENMSVISQEEMISNYLCDTILKDAQKLSLKFQVTCTLEKGPTCLSLQLDSNEVKKNKNLVTQVFHFMQTTFPKWIK